MTDPTPIVTERTIDADDARVWRAISDGDVMPEWYFEPIAEFRPETLDQAGRIPGVTPAAISLLLVHLKRGGLKASA